MTEFVVVVIVVVMMSILTYLLQQVVLLMHRISAQMAVLTLALQNIRDRVGELENDACPGKQEADLH